MSDTETTAGSGQLRGDPITGERYWSGEFARKEWDRLWTRIWHVGGLSSELAEPGDYVVHNIGHESVLMVRQLGGGVRAFYNVCRHRGNQLVWSEIGSADHFTCAYHGWKWKTDGGLESLQDPEDFGGSLCNTLRLNELRCEERFGFVWFNMDSGARPLAEELGAMAALIEAYEIETLTRVTFDTVEVDCNWKVIRDNFNESYHLPTVHPQLGSYFDEDYRNTEFTLFENGHNLMVMKGATPSPRSAYANKIHEPITSLLRDWELEPADFEGRAGDVRSALQKQMRALGPLRGRRHYERLADHQLTDVHHFTFFPNLTLTLHPDRFTFLRTEPHPTDPEKCIFDHWFFVRPSVGEKAPVEVERSRFKLGDRPVGPVFDQDLGIVRAQQKGLHSRGFTRAHLGGQEDRVQRFHEILDDILADAAQT